MEAVVAAASTLLTCLCLCCCCAGCCGGGGDDDGEATRRWSARNAVGYDEDDDDESVSLYAGREQAPFGESSFAESSGGAGVIDGEYGGAQRRHKASYYIPSEQSEVEFQQSWARATLCAGRQPRAELGHGNRRPARHG